MYYTAINMDRTLNEWEAFFNIQGNKGKGKHLDNQNSHPQHKKP